MALRSLRYYDDRLLRDIGLMQASRDGSVAGFTPLDWADLPPHHPTEDKEVRATPHVTPPRRESQLSRSQWPSPAVRV